MEENIYQVRNQSDQDPLNFPIKVNNRLANLLALAQRGDGPPNNNMGETFAILSAELKGCLADRFKHHESRIRGAAPEPSRGRPPPRRPRAGGL